MNRKNVHRVLAFVLLAGILTVFTACGAKQTEPIASGEITGQNVEAVAEALRTAGLSNTDVFTDWVRAYEKAGEDGLESEGFNDPDCRMTVMLLAGDSIRCKSVREDYTGTYLMFDLDAIENQSGFEILKDKVNLYTTLFGETPITGEDYKETYPAIWKEHGITLENPKASIISLVLSTYEGNEVFVGHTGILVEHGDGYLFVEKIAFTEPYIVTSISDPKELIALFSDRADYSTEAGELTPLIFRNEELLGELAS